MGVNGDRKHVIMKSPLLWKLSGRETKQRSWRDSSVDKLLAV